ncbi:PTH1 family peptidyl-tRNA hydrolase [Elusimicrobium posterum]|uniref:aminoacyl-tRNA hydrolase n=1 Tax=Elusimicrobium posterum TaxID=3116653 RepID=UPI003C767578
MTIRLIVGLGNPGPEYELTRHNAGFLAVDQLADKYSANFKKWQNLGDYAKISIDGNELYLLKPMTYMNLSGKAVQSLASFYKIKPSEILVCFDDMSIDLGTLRIRKNGSAGGQKGMLSTIQTLGTQDIARLRIGIGPRPEKFDVSSFVLSKFSKSETPLLEDALKKAVDAVESCVKDGTDRAMNKFN